MSSFDLGFASQFYSCNNFSPFSKEAKNEEESEPKSKEAKETKLPKETKAKEAKKEATAVKKSPKEQTALTEKSVKTKAKGGTLQSTCTNITCQVGILVLSPCSFYFTSVPAC